MSEFKVTFNQDVETEVGPEDPYIKALADTVKRAGELKIPIAYGFCGQMAIYMAKLLNQRGVSVKYVEGDCRGNDHAWLEDMSGNIIDPSVSMFYPKPTTEEYVYPLEECNGIVLYTPEEPVDFKTSLDRCDCDDEVFVDNTIPIDYEDTSEEETVDYSCKSCGVHVKSYLKHSPNPTEGLITTVFGWQPAIEPCKGKFVSCKIGREPCEGKETVYFKQAPETKYGTIAYFCEDDMCPTMVWHSPTFIFVNPDVHPKHVWNDYNMHAEYAVKEAVRHARIFLYRSEKAYALYYPKGKTDMNPIRIDLKDNWSVFIAYAENILDMIENGDEFGVPSIFIQSSLDEFFG